MTYINGADDEDALLSSLTTPNGARTTYLYDDPTFIGGAKPVSIRSPLHNLTTFTSFIVTGGDIRIRVLDPRGHNTTVISENPWAGKLENVNGGTCKLIETPLHRRYTYTYFQQRLTRSQDALGVTTFTYDELSDFSDVLAIKSVRNPASGIFTYIYNNGDNQIGGLINQKGDRTTLVWDADGFRTAVINAQQLRTSYTYNSVGQVSAVIDPLLRRTTYVYDAMAERAAVINSAGGGLRTSTTSTDNDRARSIRLGFARRKFATS